MKKSLLALAALTAFAGVASAQSSVTLFGIVDLAARNVKNHSGTIKSLSTNGQVSSRLGVRGIEDLGGGMRAGFWLEGDLVGDTGNPAGQTWQRRSTVSLIGGFGEIRLGRDYNPVFNTFVSHDPFAYVGVASSGNLRSRFYATPVGNASLAARQDNSISYFLPAMGGLYGQVMVAAGEGPASRGNKYTGLRLGYAAGPLNFSGAYGKADRTGGMVDDQTTFVFGGSFNAGFATFHASYENAEYSTTKRKLATIAAVIPVGTGAFKAQYAKASGATLIGLGYVQGLSKRTSLYTNFGRVQNKGSNVYTASASGPAVTLGGKTSTGFDVGVRHDF
jgi:predicted porin